MLPQLPVDTTQDRQRKLAKYIAHGVDPAQAGIAVGFNLSQVVALQEDQRFLQVLQEERAEIVNSQVDVNSLYDELEKAALKNLQATAKISADPELNMRIAIMANRAQRRGSGFGPTNAPLNGKGGQVKIQLGVTFVNKVKDSQGVDKQENVQTIEMEATDMDTASPQQVEDAFKAIDVGSMDPLNRLAKMGTGEID